MLLNASTLNGVVLNGTARNAFLLALCAVVASADVAAQASITRYGAATVAASSDLASDPKQRFAAGSAITPSVAILAVLPYQTYASSAVLLTSGNQQATADITRYCGASLPGSTQVTSAAWLKQAANSAVTGSAAVTATDWVRALGAASIAAAATVSPQATRRCFSGGAMGAAATVTANGKFVQKGAAAGAGSALITAHAGFGIPSATVVVSSASISAYAKANRLARANPSGSAQATATAKVTAAGVANILGSAQASAWVVQVQGAAAATAQGTVSSTATYVYMGNSSMQGAVAIAADSVITRYVDALLDTSAQLRVEPKVNNLLDGYSNPGALSTLAFNATGVVVAPLISHFYGSAQVVPMATYIHQAKAQGGAQATIAAAGVYHHQAAASVSTASAVTSQAHFRWPAMAAVSIDVGELEAYPALRQRATATLVSNGVVQAQAHYRHTAQVAASTEVQIAANGLVTTYPVLTMGGQATVTAEAMMIGNPAARDPVERTMRRPYVNRVMRRPFVNRTMKAIRT